MAEPQIDIDGYVLRGYIGAGRFADVYRYEHEWSHQQVAVRALHESFDSHERAQLFLDNSTDLTQVSAHPALLSLDLVGVDQQRGRPYIVEKYCVAPSLATRLLHAPLRLDEALTMLITLSGGLATAHLCGLVHGNIHPGNILFPEPTQPVLADFSVGMPGTGQMGSTEADVEALAGIARLALNARDQSTLTGALDAGGVNAPGTAETLGFALQQVQAQLKLPHTELFIDQGIVSTITERTVLGRPVDDKTVLSTSRDDKTVLSARRTEDETVISDRLRDATVLGRPDADNTVLSERHGAIDRDGDVIGQIPQANGQTLTSNELQRYAIRKIPVPNVSIARSDPGQQPMLHRTDSTEAASKRARTRLIGVIAAITAAALIMAGGVIAIMALLH